MAKVCYYCKGDRILRNGNYCHVCGGTGDHPDWFDKYCRCGKRFEVCTKWDSEPDYCPRCQETQYKQCPNCGGRIHYKIFWNNIPEYCECRGFRSKYCANARCRKEFFYHCEQERVSDYCKECRQWQYKQCPNGDGTIRYKIYWEKVYKYCSNCKGWLPKNCAHCSRRFEYHVEWQNIPDYCKECSQWLEKSCPYCNRGTIRYKTWWENPPTMCKGCWSNKDQIVTGLRMGDKLYFECAEDILPFLGKTPQECGYTSGKAERRIIKGKDVIHVTVYNQDWLFERAKRIKKRFSYNLDPYTGQYIEDSAHATVESLDNPESPPRHEQLNRLFRRFRH